MLELVSKEIAYIYDLVCIDNTNGANFLLMTKRLFGSGVCNHWTFNAKVRHIQFWSVDFANSQWTIDS